MSTSPWFRVAMTSLRLARLHLRMANLALISTPVERK